MNYYHSVDLHVHSIQSFDSDISPEIIVQNAIENNYSLISITDHLDFNPKDPAYGHYSYGDAKDLYEKIKENNKKINFIFGVEIGYEKVREKEIKDYLQDKEFKLKIGSIHTMEDTIISEWMKNFKDDEIEYAAKKYYDEIKNLILSNLFNVIGHFDYYKKYATNVDIAKSLYKKFYLKIEEIFKEGIDRNVFPEINLSGLRQPPKEIYPSINILEIYKDIDGKYVSVGTDAHKIEHLRYGIEEAEKIIKKFNFKIIEF